MATGNIPASVRIAVAFSLGQKYIAFVVQLALAIILARLLTPKETGIYSLAAATVALASLLREFGTSDYVISRKDISQDQLRAAFTITLLSAWFMAAVLLTVAAPMASAYKEPGVAELLRFLSVNFFLLPFGTMASAILSKELRFGPIFAIGSVSTLVGAVVTLWTAWTGHSYMSLAYGSVASNISTITLLKVLGHANVFMLPTSKGLGEVLRFGGSLTLSRAAEQGSSRAADFIVSAFLGFSAVGLLSKSNSLIGSFHEFFNSAVARVATPALAPTQTTDAESRERYYEATVLVASVQLLFFPALGIFAPEIVHILFGENWLACVPLVQISTVAALVWAPFMLSNSLLTARGAVADLLRIQIINAPLLVSALLIGAQHSLVAVVVLSSLTIPVRVFLLQRAVVKHCGIRFWPLMHRLWPSIVVAAFAASGALISRWLLIGYGVHSIFVMLAGFLIMTVFALSASYYLRHPLYIEILSLQRTISCRVRRRFASK